MDVTIALQRAVRSFPAGTDALAAQLQMSRASLLHKVSPTYPTAHCSPEEALEIMDVTGDHGALHAQAQHLGYVLLPAPRSNDDKGHAMQALAVSVREFGEFVAVAAQSMADGTVTSPELNRLQAEGTQAMAAMQQLMKTAQAMHQAHPATAGGGTKRSAIKLAGQTSQHAA